MLYAKFVRPDSGYEGDQQSVKKNGFELNKMYEVNEVDMGQSHTSIYFKNIKGSFNSVHFDFYEDDKPIDIFRDPRYNPYIKSRFNNATQV